ncbi:MAG: hypothetical protein ABIG96_01820 [Candidatus Micrarchaeota archaeon]
MKIIILAALVFSLAIFGCTSSGGDEKASLKPGEQKIDVNATTTPIPTSQPANSAIPNAEAAAIELEAQQTESASDSILTEVSDIDAVISDLDALIIEEGLN